jgi:hypothetical protein
MGVYGEGGAVSRSSSQDRLYIYASLYNVYGGRRLFISIPGIYWYQTPRYPALKVRKKVSRISKKNLNYFSGLFKIKLTKRLVLWIIILILVYGNKGNTMGSWRTLAIRSNLFLDCCSTIGCIERFWFGSLAIWSILTHWFLERSGYF